MMRGPNKTVQAARRRKWNLVHEHVFAEGVLADQFADANRRPGVIVRVTRFRVGRRLPPWKQAYNFAVRIYRIKAVGETER